MNGSVTEENYSVIDDDWTIEERCKEALNYWQQNGVGLSRKMEKLSGGQKTKVDMKYVFR